MKRGTRVAQAYTEMHVDGSDMNKEIVDAVDDAQPGVEKSGDRAGKGYGDSFDKAFADRIAKKISKSLDKSLNKAIRKTGKNLGKTLSESLVEGLGDFEESTSRMIDSLEESLNRVSGNAGKGGGGSKPPTGPRLGRDGEPDPNEKPNMAFYKTFVDTRARMVDQANKAIEASDMRLLKIRQKVQLDTAKAEQKSAAAYSKMWNAAHAENIKRTQKSAAVFEKIWDAAHAENTKRTQKAADAFDKIWNAAHAEDIKRTQRNADAFTKIWAAAHAEDIKRTRKAEEERQRLGARRTGPSIGDRVGSLFGAGSRNNFLNTFGSSLGGLVGITDKVTKGTVSMFGTFSKGFNSVEATGGRVLGLFQKIGGGLGAVGARGGAALGSIAASGPGALAAILAVGAAMTVMVTIAGALVAVVIALAATIVSGLVASLAVLGGAIGAIVVAGGLLTAAFMSMTDAQKTMLKDAFRPLREEMVGLGQIMIQQMIPSFKTWSENLQDALVLAEPVARAMGQAFADAGNILTKSFSGPGFQALATSLGVYLPGIVAKLSNALGQFLNGAAGVFSALLPYVEMFAGYLERVATRFSMWANSAGGQNAIANFMDRALVSLQSLWDAVREFGGVLSDLLFSPAAMSAGNSLFDGLADSLSDLRTYIAEAAANGDLERWFKEGAKFAKELGKALAAITKAIVGLYNSDVLNLLTKGFEGLALAVNAIRGTSITRGIRDVGGSFGSLAAPIIGATDLVTNLAYTISGATRSGTQNIGAMIGSLYSALAVSARLRSAVLAGASGIAEGAREGVDRKRIDGLINSGRNALAGTDIPKASTPKTPAKYVNPYKAYAESLISQAPSIRAQIREAMKTLIAAANSGLADAVNASDGGSAASSLASLSSSLSDQGRTLADSARSGLDEAARDLANAGSKAEAKAALARVRQAQKGMAQALEAQRGLNRAARIIADQQNLTESSIQALLNGNIGGQSLAEFAEARARLSVKIEEANQKLASAIAMRDDYSNSIKDSITTFGGLATVQARTINGVQQALTATDFTDTLQERLDRIRAFQDNLRILVSQGLNDAAYKQILDAGVDQGGSIAEALVNGAAGTVGEINNLVNQIGAAGDSLGREASSRLYQAGVDAAQGLVDGLNSLSGQLDSAAARLGEQIANSLRNALGIHSPSRVMIGMMDQVGDGGVIGLDNQQAKMGEAAARLSDAIQITPGSARSTSSSAADDSVSGNGDPRFRDLIVQTPTKDPVGVAYEVLDEVVGRL